MGSKNKDAAKTTTPTTAQPVIATQNFPAFMPGQQGLLADQLTAGGFGTVPQNMGLLSGLYHDQTMPMISRPDQIAQYLTQIGLKPVTAADATAATGVGNGRGSVSATGPAVGKSR